MCSVFFLYLLFFKLYRSGNNKSLFSATTFTLVTGIFCFCCCYVFFCIRQHDVNILRTEKLEKRRYVCVLRFFLLLHLLRFHHNQQVENLVIFFAKTNFIIILSSKNKVNFPKVEDEDHLL